MKILNVLATAGVNVSREEEGAVACFLKRRQAARVDVPTAPRELIVFCLFRTVSCRFFQSMRRRNPKEPVGDRRETRLVFA